jgi:hypothetical protein
MEQTNRQWREKLVMEKNKNQEANQDSDVSKHKTYISGTLQLV